MAPSRSKSGPRYPGTTTADDGSGGVVWVETHISQAACAYPITPTTSMGVQFAQAVANGEANMWGDPLAFFEAESEHSSASAAEGSLRSKVPTATTLITIAWLATFSSALAMIFWNYGILQLGAVRAGQYLHLIPAFTIVLAIIVLGETLGPHHIAGIVLIAIGLGIAARR